MVTSRVRHVPRHTGRVEAGDYWLRAGDDTRVTLHDTLMLQCPVCGDQLLSLPVTRAGQAVSASAWQILNLDPLTLGGRPSNSIRHANIGERLECHYFIIRGQVVLWSPELRPEQVS